MASKRIMGIDYGERRIGIALSDPLGILASGFTTISWRGGDLAGPAEEICRLIREQDVAAVVVGIPRRTDGKAGHSESRARELAALIQTGSGLVPILQDERYTSVLAGRVMQETGVRQERRRQIVDQIAAEILLQEYLDRSRGKG